jgi:uncharacterized membrane protein YdjX (TVP38/TMEM64 family)
VDLEAPTISEQDHRTQKVIRWILVGVLLSSGLVFVFEGPRVFLTTTAGFLMEADVVGLRDYLRSFGDSAWMLTTALMVLQGIIAPLPAFPITLVNALIYGPWIGALVSWTSAQGAALICFYIARGFGRPVVEAIFPKTHLARFDKFFDEHGGMSIFAMRLLPLVGFDLVSYASGLTHVRTRYYLLATGLGQLPAAIFYSYAGAELADAPGKAILMMSGFAAFMLTMMSLIFWYKRRRSQDQA